jgi:hypothetical protein
VADGVDAFNGQAVDSVTAPAARDDKPSGVVAFAGREPGRTLAIVLALHVLIWTVIPLLVSPNIQLDLAEDLALGKEWQLGYWKHPPLPWWIADLAYRAIGHVDVVYVLGPLAVVACLYGVWLLARETAGPVVGLAAVLALEGVHYYNFSAVKFAHDQMQLPFWAFTGLFFYRAIKHSATRDWLLAGALLAGAFWSKYAAFSLAATLGLFLLVDPVGRRVWRTRGPYLMAAVFAAVIAPNFWWVVGHDFLPFYYVDERAEVAARWAQYFTFPLQWIGSQVFCLLPAAGLVALLCADGRVNKRPAAQPIGDEAAFDRRYVTWLALGPFLVTTVVATALGRLIISMWGYPLWSFAPLAALLWLRPVAGTLAVTRFAIGFIALFVAAPAIYVVAELGEPLLRDRPKASQFDGQQLADIVTREWHARYGTPLVYVGGTEFASNNIAIYSPDHPHVVVHGQLRLSPWVDPAELREHGGVIVWQEGAVGSNLSILKANFGAFEQERTVDLPRLTRFAVAPDRVVYAFVPPRP